METIQSDTVARPAGLHGRWTRKRAFLVHLLGSATLVGMLSLVVFLVWYPHPYYLSEDSLIPLRILVGVDVVLGPLMTLILFRPGKKGLWLDMSIILLMQVAAFCYGTWVVYAERPLYLPFAVDRFVVVAASQVDLSTVQDPALVRRWNIGPLPVFAEPPKDPKEKSELLLQVLGGGKDVERLPKYYRPFERHLEEVRAKGQAVSVLLARHPESRPDVERLLARHGVSEGEVLVYFMDGGIRDLSLLMKGSDGTILGAVDAVPW